MTINQLIIGNIYYGEWNGHKGLYIFKFNDSKCQFINITDGKYKDTNANFGSVNADLLREATKNEILWLNTCIRRNEFVSSDCLDEVINDYLKF